MAAAKRGTNAHLCDGVVGRTRDPLFCFFKHEEKAHTQQTNRIALHTCLTPPPYVRGTGQPFHYDTTTVASAAHSGDVTGLHFIAEDALLSTSGTGAIHAWKVMSEAGPPSTVNAIVFFRREEWRLKHRL